MQLRYVTVLRHPTSRLASYLGRLNMTNAEVKTLLDKRTAHFPSDEALCNSKLCNGSTAVPPHWTPWVKNLYVRELSGVPAYKDIALGREHLAQAQRALTHFSAVIVLENFTQQVVQLCAVGFSWVDASMSKNRGSASAESLAELQFSADAIKALDAANILDGYLYQHAQLLSRTLTLSAEAKWELGTHPSGGQTCVRRAGGQEAPARPAKTETGLSGGVAGAGDRARGSTRPRKTLDAPKAGSRPGGLVLAEGLSKHLQKQPPAESAQREARASEGLSSKSGQQQTQTKKTPSPRVLGQRDNRIAASSVLGKAAPPSDAPKKAAESKREVHVRKSRQKHKHKHHKNASSVAVPQTVPAPPSGKPKRG